MSRLQIKKALHYSIKQQHWAQAYRKINLLSKELLSHHNFEQTLNNTYLHHALGNKAPAFIIELLLKKGLHPNSCDSEGFSALGYAIQFHPNADVLELLLKYGGDINQVELIQFNGQKTNICHALGLILMKCPQHLELFFKYKASPDTIVTIHGLRLLHVAIRRGMSDYVAILLKNGANPNLKDNIGYSAFEWAFECNASLEIFRLLKLYGGALEYSDDGEDDEADNETEYDDDEQQEDYDNDDDVEIESVSIQNNQQQHFQHPSWVCSPSLIVPSISGSSSSWSIPSPEEAQQQQEKLSSFYRIKDKGMQCDWCNCSNILVFQCKGCQYAYYCSYSCMNIHWIIHKQNCNHPNNFKQHCVQ
jgi:ankyrin repeat protein